MTISGNQSRLGALILLWLLTQSDKRTLTRLHAALKPLLEHRRTDAQQRDAIDSEIAALEKAGLLTRTHKSGLALTEDGRRAGLASLGVPALPPRTTWRVVKERYLIALSLGSSLPLSAVVAKRLADINGLRAAILSRHNHLKTDMFPTHNQVKDKLAWLALGVETDQPFTKEAALRLLLSKRLDDARPQSSDAIIEQLAAGAVGATRSEAPYIRLALQRRWLDEQAPALSPAATRPETPSKVAAAPAPAPDGALTDDNAFAARVLAAARAAKSGRFGDNKVFISHVFQHLKDEGSISEDLTAFKARLGAAHFRGLLSLSRADLVEAMAPADVDASETQHEHATFHFVRI